MWYMIVLIIVILVIFLWWMGRPLYRRNVRREEFDKFFRDFLSQMADGAVIIIEHQGSSRFVQFAKYGSHSSDNILHFGYPDAPWSLQYFDRLAEILRSTGIDLNIVTTGEDPVRRFLEVDIGKEDLEGKISRASQISRVTFEVMGLDESARFRIHFEGTISDEAARPSLEILRNHPSELLRKFAHRSLKKLDKKAQKDGK